MEVIRQYFEQTVTISEEDWQFFASRLIEQELSKNELLLVAGQTENYLSFIEHGITRYYIEKEEQERTFAFSFKHSFVSAYNSFLTRTPSGYNIQALTKTKLWRIRHSDLQTVYRETSVGNTIGRHAGEALFLKKSERELALLNETAEQRYLNLFTEQPQLIKEIPLKYIASYIGITPQALSRIRKRIS
ncbi:MAG: Crp/Fnr family transcriptional regulator [Taibaiella sp.]|nr:Crp/Fnr family transcriptional regulator [Taibaiella sp.]